MWSKKSQAGFESQLPLSDCVNLSKLRKSHSPSLAVKMVQTLKRLKIRNLSVPSNCSIILPYTSRKGSVQDWCGFRERNWKEVSQVVTDEEKPSKRIMPNFRTSQLGL